jgi:hypothetical protein
MLFAGTENAYLRAWFRAQKSWTTPITLPGRRDTSLSFDDTLTGSPRQMQLRDVGERTIAGGQFTILPIREPILIVQQNFLTSIQRIPLSHTIPSSMRSRHITT